MRKLRKVASIMLSGFILSIDLMIQGYRVFKDLRTDPDYNEKLECVCEPGNLSDPYVMAVKNISGDTVVVGHVLDQYLQYLCSIFIRQGGMSHMHPAAIRGFLKLLCWPL